MYGGGGGRGGGVRERGCDLDALTTIPAVILLIRSCMYPRLTMAFKVTGDSRHLSVGERVVFACDAYDYFRA